MKIYHIAILLCLLINIYFARAEVDMNRIGYSILFTTYKGEECQLIFHLNPNNKSEIIKINLMFRGKKMTIESDEIDINLMSRLDDVRVSFDDGDKKIYILLIDNIGVKGARKENRFFFIDYSYVKRTKIDVSDNDDVVYYTKEKGKKEVQDFKVNPPQSGK